MVVKRPDKPARRLIPAAGYVRMSGDGQELSPQQQRRAIEAFALAHGYLIVVWYEDLAISGDTDIRPGFDAMAADAVGGKWECVLVWDEARFGRWDELDAGHFIFPFRRAGRKLVIVKDAKVIDWDDSTDRLIFVVTQSGRNKENRDRAANTARGKQAAAELGNWQGKAPWSYEVDILTVSARERKGRKWRWLEPVDELVPWVRWLFQAWARDGWSVYAIVRHLTENKVPGPNGGAWSPNTLRDILRNVVYVGHTFYGRRTKAKYWRLTAGGLKAPTAKAPTGKDKKGRRPPARNAESEVTVVRNTHKPLVDEETFTLAQDRFAEEAARNARPGAGACREVILFSGMVRCGCGAKMHGRLRYTLKHVRCPKCNKSRMIEPRPGRPAPRCKVCGAECPVKPGAPRISYTCEAYKAKGLCEYRRVHEDDLKRAVIDEVLGGILNRPGLREEVTRRVSERAAGGPGEAADLKRQIAALKGKIALGAERFLVCPPEATAEAAAALARWRGELEVAEGRLSDVSEAALSAKDAKKLVKETLDAVDNLKNELRIGCPLGKNSRRRQDHAALYRRLITRIDVSFDGKTPVSVAVTLNRAAFELRNLASHLGPILARLRDESAEDAEYQAARAHGPSDGTP